MKTKYISTEIQLHYGISDHEKNIYYDLGFLVLLVAHYKNNTGATLGSDRNNLVF